MNSFEERLKRLFLATDSQTDSALARILKIQPPSIAGARKRQQIPTGWIEKIAEEFDINANWLFFGIGAMTNTSSLDESDDFSRARQEPFCKKDLAFFAEDCRTRTIPVMGLAACGLAGWYNSSQLALRVAFPIEYSRDSGIFAVVAIGTSMQPEGIRHGFLLFCDPAVTPVAGDPIYIEKVDGMVSVKRFLRQDEAWLYVEGWLEPNTDGVQKIYTEKLLLSTIHKTACVVVIRRKA